MNCQYCFDPTCTGVGPCPADEEADDFIGLSGDVLPALEAAGLMVKRDWGCKDPACCASSGICESMTFGRGRLSHNGYWEFPCFECARAWEKKYPAEGACWPFESQSN